MYAVVAVVGFVGVVTGFPAVLTVGDVQVFLSYANQYTKPFNEISGVVTQIQGAFASARRVFALLDAPEDDMGEKPFDLDSNDGAAMDSARNSVVLHDDLAAVLGASLQGGPKGDVVFH